MPIVLLLIGGVLLLAAMRGDPQQVGVLVQRDFTGAQGFATFAAAFVLIGAVGFVPELRALSRTFLVLMVVALILSFQRRGGNLFTRLETQWNEITAAPRTAPATPNAQRN